MNEKKLKHLEFVQGIITRMGGNLFYLRGWVITLIAGILVFLTQKNIGLFPFIFLILVIVIFWGYDAYFLAIERKYRLLYEKIRKLNEDDIDFSMSVAEFNSLRETSMVYCAFSSTLLLFYGQLLLATLYVIIFII